MLSVELNLSYYIQVLGQRKGGPKEELLVQLLCPSGRRALVIFFDGVPRGHSSASLTHESSRKAIGADF